MLNLSKVAVTGCLSSGKSTVCEVFRERGAAVISADAIVHQLLSPETPLGHRIIELLGQDIVVENQIDRSKIAKKVFNQTSLLKSLENLIHPAVKEEIEKQYKKVAVEGKASLFVAEIPLLFEAGFDKDFPITIAVHADRNLCKMRYPGEDFEERIKQQLSSNEKAERADFVIENNGTKQELKKQVNQLYEQIKC